MTPVTSIKKRAQRTQVTKKPVKQKEELNVFLTDKQINELLKPLKAKRGIRGFPVFNIGIISVELNPLELVNQRAELEVKLLGIPVGHVTLDSGSVSQTLGPNIYIAKASITLTVSWEERRIMIDARACVRKKWFKWGCTSYSDTVTTW
ncbi:MAG: hypothetical protein E8D48_08785 [Nitrospira sp.]|nr:MAG: hypothetical protein E8D48_08785 [Nitrospira sp.]